MKKIFLLALCLGLLASNVVTAQHKKAKKTTTAPVVAAKNDTLQPYQKNTKLPAFRIMMLDSSTVLNTFNIPEGKPVLLFYFGAECDHCQKTWDALVKDIDSLQDYRIYMFSFSPIYQIKKFAEKNKLNKYTNVIVGRDEDLFFPSFYGARSVPYLAVYNKKKKFVTKFDGHVSVKELYEAETAKPYEKPRR